MTNILKKEFKREIWIMYVTMFFLMFSSIFIRLIQINNFDETFYTNNEYTSYQIPFLITGVLAIVISTILFKYLHNKEQLDLEHSLPISRKNLFIVKYFKGILYFAIPYLTTIITLMIIDKLIYPEVSILSLELILFFIKYLLLIIFVYTVFVFANILSGMSVYSVVIGVLLLTIIPIFSSVARMQYSIGDLPLLVNYFNFNQVISIYLLQDINTNYYSILHYILIIIILLLFNLIIYYLSLNLYLKRKSENVVVPVAFNKLKYLLNIFVILSFSFIIAFPFLELGRTKSIGMILSIIVINILTIIYELILNSGYKKLKLKNYLTTAIPSSLFMIFIFVFLNSSILLDITTVEVNCNEIYYAEYIVNDLTGESTTVTLPTPLDYEETISLLEELEAQNKNEEFEKMKELNNLKNNEDYEKYWQVIVYLVLDNNNFQRGRTFYLDKNITEDIGLINKILSLDTEQSLYNLAYNNYSNITSIDLNSNEYQYRTFTTINDGIKKYPYFFSTSIADGGDEFRVAFEKDLAKLSEEKPLKSSLVFDNIPLAVANYNINDSNNDGIFTYENENVVPITTDWENTLPIITLPNTSFTVFDIVENQGILNEVETRSNVYSYINQLSDTDEYIYDLNSYLLDSNFTNFSSNDVINGKVNVKVYTGELSAKAIIENNLKLIKAYDTQKVYFGIVE